MSKRCIKSENKDAVLYNRKLQKLLPAIEASLPGSKILYANVYDPMMDMIKHPARYGFKETKTGCCGSGGGLSDTCDSKLSCVPITRSICSLTPFTLPWLPTLTSLVLLTLPYRSFLMPKAIKYFTGYTVYVLVTMRLFYSFMYIVTF
ncbi:SGNH hydrolase-type esterase domain protein [Raphanus sativus]|uniref:GDSL esterase/lipase At2g30310-like n=1 Tax=Raphanus sativus TaxID=3726 RepID=A0A9W3CX90_RAPSA|nr:GDSL esterase/lipase At2g30310-like [Raphanus sativus]KAJ4867987.1 SGNH hydrolase-type esterase domain protein [Raphanus sativus]